MPTAHRWASAVIALPPPPAPGSSGGQVAQVARGSLLSPSGCRWPYNRLSINQELSGFISLLGGQCPVPQAPVLSVEPWPPKAREDGRPGLRVSSGQSQAPGRPRATREGAAGAVTPTCVCPWPVHLAHIRPEPETRAVRQVETGGSSQVPGRLDETQTCQGQSLPEVEEGGSSTRSLRPGDPGKDSCPLPLLLDAGRAPEARLSLAESGKITSLASGTLEPQDLGKRALDFRQHPATWVPARKRF